MYYVSLPTCIVFPTLLPALCPVSRPGLCLVSAISCPVPLPYYYVLSYCLSESCFTSCIMACHCLCVMSFLTVCLMWCPASLPVLWLITVCVLCPFSLTLLCPASLPVLWLVTVCVLCPFSLSVLCPASLPVLWFVSVCTVICLVSLPVLCTASQAALSCLICVYVLSRGHARSERGPILSLSCLSFTVWTGSCLLRPDMNGVLSLSVLSQGHCLNGVLSCLRPVLTPDLNGVLSCLCPVSRSQPEPRPALSVSCIKARSDLCPGFASVLFQGHCLIGVLSCLWTS